jgi:hypothetical protein
VGVLVDADTGEAWVDFVFDEAARVGNLLTPGEARQLGELLRRGAERAEELARDVARRGARKGRG